VDAVVCGNLLSGPMDCLSLIFSEFLVGANIFVVGHCSLWHPPVYAQYLKFSRNFFYRG